MMRLSGRVALVTGGASGLGFAIANRLQSEGAQVVITDIEEEAGRDAATRLKAIFLRQDVSDERQWTEVVDTVETQVGQLTVLINNAGILGSMDEISPEDTPYSEWRRVMTVNGDSVFLGCKAAIPAMRRAGGGAIVNLSSIAALLATPYATAYGASKGVVRHLTRSVAQYCGEKGMKVRCNSIHPGIVQTGMWFANAEAAAKKRGLTLDDIIAEASSVIPLGDLTQAEDIAAAAAFLVSDDARHITGEQLIVDGGLIECDTFKPSRWKS